MIFFSRSPHFSKLVAEPARDLGALRGALQVNRDRLRRVVHEERVQRVLLAVHLLAEHAALQERRLRASLVVAEDAARLAEHHAVVQLLRRRHLHPGAMPLSRKACAAALMKPAGYRASRRACRIRAGSSPRAPRRCSRRPLSCTSARRRASSESSPRHRGGVPALMPCGLRTSAAICFSAACCPRTP
jgi:hypothetical protein